MRTVGDKVHSYNNNCIYSVAKSNGDSIKFSLSNAEQRDSWLNSGHQTLAADNLRKLCRENAGINLLEEEQLMSFKRRFLYITQKCLKPPAVTGNRKLIELFVKTLDGAFQDVLNSRLSI